jgi:hypothetical protein
MSKQIFKIIFFINIVVIGQGSTPEGFAKPARPEKNRAAVILDKGYETGFVYVISIFIHHVFIVGFAVENSFPGFAVHGFIIASKCLFSNIKIKKPGTVRANDPLLELTARRADPLCCANRLCWLSLITGKCAYAAPERTTSG